MGRKGCSYSKMLPIITGLLFIGCLYICLISPFAATLETAIIVAALTVTGSIFGTAILWYMKKAQAENTVTLKTIVYETAAKTKLEYLEKTLQLKSKYDNKYDLDTSTEDDLDSFEDAALNDLASSADAAMDEATTSIEKENYY